MRTNSSIISYDQFLTSRGEKKQFLVVSDFLPRRCLTCSLACQVRHPILSLSILHVILFGAIYYRLLVKPHPASPQPLPADVVSTQRTKYKNHLTPMGWRGPLSFGRFKSVQHNQSTGHLLLLTPPALLSLLHSFLILCSIGSPYFLLGYMPVSCRVVVFEYDFLGWIPQG